MTFEQIMDLGLALFTLMKVSTGKEITFALGKVIVKGEDGIERTANASNSGITLLSIETAIELASTQ